MAHAPPLTRLTLIVAATKNNGIGQNGRLPWRLPKELAYFARVTSSAPPGQMNAVIMGRKTWESIPARFKPLPGRVNVVISGNHDYKMFPPDSSPPPTPVHLHTDLNSAVQHLSQHDHTKGAINRTFVIGGVSLYSASLDLSLSSHLPSSAVVDRILLTRILTPGFDHCDVFMPDFIAGAHGGKNQWERASHEDLEAWLGFEVPVGVQEENSITYEFQMWVRTV